MKAKLSEDVHSAIVFSAVTPENMVLTMLSVGHGAAADELDFTLGDGGFVVQFRRTSSGDWILNHVNGEDVDMSIGDDGLLETLENHRFSPTIYAGCNPDDPTEYVAAFTKADAMARDGFGDDCDPDAFQIDINAEEDTILDLVWDQAGPSGGDEILTACWAVAQYLAIRDLLCASGVVARRPEAYDPFGADGLDGDIERHGELFVELIRLAFGADAANRERAALGLSGETI